MRDVSSECDILGAFAPTIRVWRSVGMDSVQVCVYSENIPISSGISSDFAGSSGHFPAAPPHTSSKAAAHVCPRTPTHRDLLMAPSKAAQQPRPAPESRPVNQRGVLWQAEKLTGNRAQRGNLPGGAPRWTYEVKWKGAHKSTYETADCLVGWEADMKEADEECARRALLPKVNPFVEAQKRREAAAKKKAEDMMKRKERLQRLACRRVRLDGGEPTEESDGEEADDDVDEADEALDQEGTVRGHSRTRRATCMHSGPAEVAFAI